MQEADVAAVEKADVSKWVAERHEAAALAARRVSIEDVTAQK